MIKSKLTSINGREKERNLPIILKGSITGCIFLFFKPSSAICIYGEKGSGWKVGELSERLVPYTNEDWIVYDGDVILSNQDK